MFFFLSKTLDLLLDPLWWLLAPCLVGVALHVKGYRRLGLGAIASGVGVVAALSLPSVSNRLWHALEADAVSTMRPDVTYDLVVLLGGTVAAFGATADQVAFNDNVDRLIATYDLLRAGRARKVIVSGGALRLGLPTEAEFLSGQLQAWGIPPERIIVEAQARNTAENATLSKALIEAEQAGSVLMVTSAFHLPRSLETFRAAGLNPDTLAVDYRMRDPSADEHWLPRAEYLAESSAAIREFAGRFIYRLRR